MMLTDEQVAEMQACAAETIKCENCSRYHMDDCLRSIRHALLTDRAELVAEVGRLESENRMLLGARRDPADIAEIKRLREALHRIVDQVVVDPETAQHRLMYRNEAEDIAIAALRGEA